MTNEERRFIIDTMTWSFSRLNSFCGCRQEWLLKYIEEPHENNLDSCYGQGGGFAHELLEGYYKGEVDFWELPLLYETEFSNKVTEHFPTINGKNLRDNYFNKILEYFENFEPLENKYEILGVEKKVEFKIDKYSFIGFIDLLLKNRDTKEIIILDHKSSSMKFKKDGNLAKTSLPKFKEFQRQLYLYSIPIIKEYGRVDYLKWNLFKDRSEIIIPWNRDDCNEAKSWALQTIDAINNENDWDPSPNFMYCNYLCSKRCNCEYKYKSKDV